MTLSERIPIEKRKEVWFEYLQYGMGLMIERYGNSKTNHQKIRRFLHNKCREPYKRVEFENKGFGKQESYWSSEDELTYTPPTYEELSLSEKRIFNKL
jgi:hypothetical protein